MCLLGLLNIHIRMYICMIIFVFARFMPLIETSQSQVDYHQHSPTGDSSNKNIPNNSRLIDDWYAILAIPIPYMYGIFTYIWLLLMVKYGKCTIHGWYGIVYEKEVYKILMDYILSQTNSTDFCWILVSKLDVYFPGGNLEIWKVVSLLTKLVKHETAMVNLVIML